MTPSSRAPALVLSFFMVSGVFALQPAEATTGLPLTLHFRSVFFAGHGDWLFGTSSMGTEPSTVDFPLPPAVWHSPWAIGSARPESPYDAYWTWAPEGGYALTGVAGQVVFFATTPQNTVNRTSSWKVEIFEDAKRVWQNANATRYTATTPFSDVSEFTVPVGPFSAAGGELTLKISPWFGLNDGANAIYYDHVDFPSRLELTGGSGGTGSAPFEVDLDHETAMADRPTTWSATPTGGTPPYAHAWKLDGAVVSTTPSYTATFTTVGERHRLNVTVSDAAGASFTHEFAFRVNQRDFVGEARVVVAVLDTGVNPYHETYRRPGIELPLAEFANATDGRIPRAVNLTFSDNLTANLLADAAVWDGIESEELVWFRDTNVIGYSMGAYEGGEGPFAGDPEVPILDEHGHGTATSDTVLDAWPDAIIVMVEQNAAAFDDQLPNSYAWAAKQPWIDVISASMGMHGNAPEPFYLYQAAAAQRAAWGSGKVFVNSAGNDPSATPTDGTDGSPFVLAITGSQAGGKGKELMSSHAYSDYASNYTVTAALHTSVTADEETGGTSFSCPNVAGTIAGAIHELRRGSGWTGGIADGELVPPLDVDNGDVRDALNKTAAWVTGTGYLLGFHYNGDVLVNPVAPWTQVGWGHLDPTFIPAIVDVVESGDYTLTGKKATGATYMRATYDARSAYWEGLVETAEPFFLPGRRQIEDPGAGPSGVPIAAPGAAHDVRTLAVPVETPHPYPANADLTWTVQVPGAAGISLHFEDFDTETGYDLVQLATADGTVVAVYSYGGGADFWSAYVPGDTVLVRLTSDSAVEYDGFVVREIDVL